MEIKALFELVKAIRFVAKSLINQNEVWHSHWCSSQIITWQWSINRRHINYKDLHGAILIPDRYKALYLDNC